MSEIFRVNDGSRWVRVEEDDGIVWIVNRGEGGIIGVSMCPERARELAAAILRAVAAADAWRMAQGGGA